MTTRKNKRSRQSNRLGQRIIESLTELRDVLESGQPLSRRFTVHTVEIPDPADYSAADVHRARLRTGTSQAVFARLLGVSSELVENWEQGLSRPRPWARRLLDEISRDPAGFLGRHIRPAQGSRAA